MARTRHTKEEMRCYISDTFGYNRDKSCDDIRPTYGFDGSCQGTVPESIIAFLDSKDYEDALRLCISLGGDADTMGAITGAIAAAYYNKMPYLYICLSCVLYPVSNDLFHIFLCPVDDVFY